MTRSGHRPFRALGGLGPVASTWGRPPSPSPPVACTPDDGRVLAAMILPEMGGWARGRRRGAGRRLADQPGPAAVRRRGRHQAGSGRLPGRGGATGSSRNCADRPLSVIRVRLGQAPFMQKNVPKYTPAWVRTVSVWAEASKREVVVRAVQRPAHAAVVRQPAGGGVPPDAVPGRRLGAPDPPGARPRPAGG